MKIKRETVPQYIAPTDGTRHSTKSDAAHHELYILFGSLPQDAKPAIVADFCMAHAGLLCDILKSAKLRKRRAVKASTSPKPGNGKAVAA